MSSGDALYSTLQALVDGIKPAVGAPRSQGPNGRQLMPASAVRSALQTALKEAMLARTSANAPGSATDLAVIAPTATSTITDYYVQLTAGSGKVGGVYLREGSAQDDQKVIGAASDIQSINLAGAQAVAVSANDMDAKGALVLALKTDGATVYVHVLGAQAATGAAVAPTAAQIAAALQATTLIADLHPAGLALVLGRVTWARGTGDMTPAFVSPATDDGLAGERAGGSVYALIAES